MLVDVFVAVGVGVFVAVFVGVGVFVLVGVRVGVLVFVGVCVGVAVLVGVLVDVAVGGIGVAVAAPPFTHVTHTSSPVTSSRTQPGVHVCAAANCGCTIPTILVLRLSPTARIVDRMNLLMKCFDAMVSPLSERISAIEQSPALFRSSSDCQLHRNVSQDLVSNPAA